MDDELVLELAGVSRQFGAVRALTNVSFDCRAGEVHALVGENGSGKSTLLGIASGFVDPDRGTVRIGGRPLPRDSPALSRKLGLAMAYQDGSSVHAEPVKNNLYLRGGVGAPAVPAPEEVGAPRCSPSSTSTSSCSPMRRSATLTMAERQLFEVAKALVNEPKVLLLDEPTTALGPDEVEALHRTVLACKRRGIGVVYVSHRLPEVLEVADRITVLRDGQHQGTFDAATTTEPQLVERIVGRPFDGGVPGTGLRRRPKPRKCSSSMPCRASRSARSASPCTAVRSWGSPVPRATASRSSSTRSAGRIPPRAGRVVCGGKELNLISTREAVGAGIMLLPGDRKREALMGVLGVRVNATVQSLRRFSRLGVLRRRAERAAVQQLIEQLEIRTPWLDQPVEFLSGGNQQKVSVARSFLRDPSVILAYEPTQGVDVGSRIDIYRALRARAAAGAAVLVKSSDPIELSGL